MFRPEKPSPHHSASFPRVRGDVPGIWDWCFTNRGFSPRARGCSWPSGACSLSAHVFPACAGMFLNTLRKPRSLGRFPRVRGDVPFGFIAGPFGDTFSPRARGCSAFLRRKYGRVYVFPACAGMFRFRNMQLMAPPRFPRVRGDVPSAKFTGTVKVRFSPRARGCSSGSSGATT